MLNDIEDQEIDAIHHPELGPSNKAEEASLEETLKVRDILITQDALDHRLVEDSEGDGPPGTALLLTMTIDPLRESLPSRHFEGKGFSEEASKC